MTASSPYYQLRQMELAIRRLQPEQKAQDIGRSAEVAQSQLQRRLTLAVAALRDYERFELEEDTKAQLRALPKAVKGLEQVRESILKSSEFDLIGAVDVAQLTSELDELIERLR